MLLAAHIIFTTYMTWPPGDPRGHWSPLFDLYGHLIAKGHRLQLPDPVTLEHARGLAKETPKVLTAEEQTIVAEVFGGYLGVTPGKPGAICFAAALERNHVHLMLGPQSKRDREETVGRLKGKSSSELKKLPMNAGRTRTWTAGYWHVDIYENDPLHIIRNYIVDHNRRRNLPADPYPWIFTRMFNRV